MAAKSKGSNTQHRTFLAAALVNAAISTAEIDVAGNKVFYRRYGQRPAILMLHGFPRHAKDGGPMGIWARWVPRAYGPAMKSGHFCPEENRDDAAALVNRFLADTQRR